MYLVHAHYSMVYLLEYKLSQRDIILKIIMKYMIKICNLPIDPVPLIIADTVASAFEPLSFLHNISLLSGLASLITPLVARPLAASRGRIWAPIHFLGCGQPSESGPKIWSGL